MPDIRLQTRRFELGGKEYEILINMNVLADLQEQHDGSLAAVLEAGHGLRTALEVLAAMINEANDLAGSPERFTAREIGRILPPSRAAELQPLVAELLHAALAPDESEEDAPESENSKN